MIKSSLKYGVGYRYSFIGAGYHNRVCQSFSSIVGGCNNLSTGYFSAILGGSGNCDNGYNYVGIFGQGITNVTPNTFHVNCAVVQNIPAALNMYTCAPPAGAISGTLYYVCVPWPAVPGSMKQVWVA